MKSQKPSLFNLLPAAALLATTSALMSGCGGGNSGSASANIDMPGLSTGAYVVATEVSGSLQVGKYYVGSDGKTTLLMLQDDQSRVTRVYTKGVDSTHWRIAGTASSTDSSTDPVVKHTASIPANAFATSTLAGAYEIRLANGSRTQFSIDANGAISPVTASSCEIKGQLGASTMPQLLALSITQSNCSGLTGSWSGVAVRDQDDAPASFRLVSTDGGSLKDLWAFAK
ncbi:hypothetical protein G7047_10945 [Diaphorobacter sp. HDW4A]|uniref:hypothetical protein n=1 Tax=Diaphorobacter sp. HDW4A TaxID=2714924 RepID=UPI001408CAB8|nr:hypothetical protein [Diaphorobacter sp. HDW4A]QIL80359.1 hypothetical protein G7047_10945 [Diaphorobacter sp. HDW4A]